VEARDGIEPPNKVLQTFPFSFWVPRHWSTQARVKARSKTLRPALASPATTLAPYSRAGLENDDKSETAAFFREILSNWNS